jgi:hypothetical protein
MHVNATDVRVLLVHNFVYRCLEAGKHTSVIQFNNANFCLECNAEQVILSIYYAVFVSTNRKLRDNAAYPRLTLSQLTLFLYYVDTKAPRNVVLTRYYFVSLPRV